MRTAAIILAAGKGTRLKSRVLKPLILLAGKPLLQYSLRVFERHPGIDDIVVVVSPQAKAQVERILGRVGCRKVVGVVLGGKERQDSVRSGLAAVPRQDGVVAVHDSARPFVSEKMISALLAAAKRSGAAIPGVPVKATIKKIRGTGRKMVQQTVERGTLWEVQTPQVFRKDLLEKAFSRFGAHPVTDDAMLVEKLGHGVEVVEGSYRNIKVTSPEDILVARALMRGR